MPLLFQSEWYDIIYMLIFYVYVEWHGECKCKNVDNTMVCGSMHADFKSFFLLTTKPHGLNSFKCKNHEHACIYFLYFK